MRTEEEIIEKIEEIKNSILTENTHIANMVNIEKEARIVVLKWVLEDSERKSDQ